MIKILKDTIKIQIKYLIIPCIMLLFLIYNIMLITLALLGAFTVINQPICNQEILNNCLVQDSRNEDMKLYLLYFAKSTPYYLVTLGGIVIISLYKFYHLTLHKTIMNRIKHKVEQLRSN